jgi:two-component system, NarL family, sensor histidine kinase UhpB
MGVGISNQSASAVPFLSLLKLPRLYRLRLLWARRSIRIQLLLVFVLIDIVALFVTGSFAIVRTREQTRTEIAASMHLAELLVGDVVAPMRQELPAEQFLAALPAQLQLIRHVRIAVKDAAGTPVQRSAGTRSPDAPDAEPPTTAPAWFTALVAQPIQTHVVPVTISGRTVGEVEISGEPADEIAESWQNVVAIGSIGILLNLAMIALLYIVFGRVLDPLIALADGLSELEHESYHVRLPSPEARELAVIANHFNALAQALATARAENLELSRRLITAQDDERRRTALELHDEVGPCLFGLKANMASIAGAIAGLSAEAALKLSDRLRDIGGIIDHLQAINRSMLERLRPMALGHVPFRELLERLVHECARQHMETSFVFTASVLKQSYGDPIDLTIYRCIQESLTNAIRHAGAQHVTVELADTATRLELSVRDDGGGMDISTEAGFGIRGMRERVEGLGGRCRVESAKGGGTCIAVTLPLAGSDQRIEA